MPAYRHILAAIDFMPDRRQVTERACELAAHYQARLSLVHVVEYLPMDLANELVLPQDVELEGQLLESARRKMDAIAAELAMTPAPGIYLELGQTRAEILRVAEEEAADLIVIGSHGRHGISRLLGSTAHAILQHAPCDVLAVRIQSTSDD